MSSLWEMFEALSITFAVVVLLKFFVQRWESKRDERWRNSRR